MARDVGLAVVGVEVTSVKQWVLSALLFLVAFRVGIATERIQLSHTGDYGGRVELRREKRVAKLIDAQQPSPDISTVEKGEEVVVDESGVVKVEQVRGQGRVTTVVKGELEDLQLD